MIQQLGEPSFCVFFMFVFLAFDFFCQFCMVIRFFHPSHNGQWPQTSKDFYTRSYPLHYFLILILEKEPVFLFLMLVLNKGTTGTILITSLVWRGPWLGIEPGTSRTWCQHSTTRLSRRRLGNQVNAEECRPLLYTCTTNGVILESVHWRWYSNSTWTYTSESLDSHNLPVGSLS